MHHSNVTQKRKMMAGEKFEWPIQKVKKIFSFHSSVTTVGYLKYFFLFFHLSLINYGCCTNNLPGGGNTCSHRERFYFFMA